MGEKRADMHLQAPTPGHPRWRHTACPQALPITNRKRKAIAHAATPQRRNDRNHKRPMTLANATNVATHKETLLLPPPPPLVQRLFGFCAAAFNAGVTTLERGAAPAALCARWREERGRLRLWGDGYEAGGGRLDVVLAGDSEAGVLRSVVTLLCSLAESLAFGTAGPSFSICIHLPQSNC